MSRALNGNQLNALLASNQFMSETLIELYTGAGTNYFYTTGFCDVSYTAVGTNTTQTFSANNQIKVIGNLRESYDPNGNEVTIEWSTTDQNWPSTLNIKMLKTRVIISKMFRDIATNNVATGISVITLYDGTATALSVQGNTTENIVQLKCQSVFRNLENSKSRKTSDIEPFSSTSIIWGSIVWQ